MDKIPITIIGVGLVGLAIAEELSAKYKNVLAVEKNHTFGQETSSRAGEVIHSGMYYPPGLLKTVFCKEGNRLLYEICAERNLPHKKIGKLIVATGAEEIDKLWNLKKRAEQNGINDLAFLTRKQIRTLEPQVKAETALFSPSTGIIDSHSLMRSFLIEAEGRGATIVFRSKVTGIQYDGAFYVVEINHGEYCFQTNILINSSGLYADKVAALLGIDIDENGYRIKFSKGSFFSASPTPQLKHLVWPVSRKNAKYRGIHTTVDYSGAARFGPHWEYVSKIEYSVDDSQKQIFYESLSKYLPGIKMKSLNPLMGGIRPQLQGPGESYRDFVIKEETDLGYPGLINLIGIECPGLTDCIPIARYVSSLVQARLG